MDRQLDRQCQLDRQLDRQLDHQLDCQLDQILVQLQSTIAQMKVFKNRTVKIHLNTNVFAFTFSSLLFVSFENGFVSFKFYL